MNRLKELRKGLQLSQEELAKKINTSQRNIGRWENGENEPSATFVKNLAEFFGCTTDYLLGLEDDCNITQKKKIFTTFQKQLKDLINEKCNGRQIEITKHTGIPQSVISNYFIRQSLPSAEYLIKLADFFGCTTDYLLGREDNFGGVIRQTTVLTKDEEELIFFYRKLSDDTKQNTMCLLGSIFK